MEAEAIGVEAVNEIAASTSLAPTSLATRTVERARWPCKTWSRVRVRQQTFLHVRVRRETRLRVRFLLKTLFRIRYRLKTTLSVRVRRQRAHHRIQQEIQWLLLLCRLLVPRHGPWPRYVYSCVAFSCLDMPPWLRYILLYSISFYLKTDNRLHQRFNQ